jgi:zinc transporter ZupT
MGVLDSVYGQAGLTVVAALLGSGASVLGLGERRTAARVLTQFAGGAFLAVALLHLLPEAASGSGWLVAFVAALFGWLAAALLGRYAGAHCPACDNHPESAVWVRLRTSFVWVVAFHCVMDGLAMSGLAAHPEESGALVLALLAHKLPEGIALGSVFAGSGMRPAAAFGYTALIEAGTLLGTLLGVFVEGLGPFLGPMLGLVAGSFVYLAVLTVIGSRDRTHPLWSAVPAVIGVLFIVAARLAFGGH